MKAMRLFVFPFDEIKCGGCNWETTQLFVIAESKKEARRLLRSGDAGLCGSCMCELLVDGGYEITFSKDRLERERSGRK